MNYELYQFVETDIGFLDVIVPSVAKWGLIPVEWKDDGEVVTIPRTAGDFITLKRISLDGQYVTFMLCAHPSDGARPEPLTEQDLIEWDYYLYNVHGISRDEWMDLDEYKQLMNSPQYKEVQNEL